MIEPPNPDPGVNNSGDASFTGLKLCLKEPDSEWVIDVSGKIELLETGALKTKSIYSASLLEFFVAVMEYRSKRKCLRCDALRSTKGITVSSKFLCTLQITQCCIFPTPYMLVYKIFCPCVLRGQHCITAAVNYNWGGFFEHQTMWISAVKNKVNGRFSWDKYQV